MMASLSDEHKENGYLPEYIYSILGKSYGWPLENQLPRPERWRKLTSVKCSWTLGIYWHGFKCILVVGDPFSQWKIDFSSPRGVSTLDCEFHSQAGLASISWTASGWLAISPSAYSCPQTWPLKRFICYILSTIMMSSKPMSWWNILPPPPMFVKLLSTRGDPLDLFDQAFLLDMIFI